MSKRRLSLSMKPRALSHPHPMLVYLFASYDGSNRWTMPLFHKSLPAVHLCNREQTLQCSPVPRPHITKSIPQDLLSFLLGGIVPS